MQSMTLIGFATLLGAAALAISCGDDGTTSSGTTTTTSMGGAGGSGTGGAIGGGGAATTSTGGSGGAGGSGGGCVDSLPVVTTLPDSLADTGLFSDIATDEIAANVRAYEPIYKLWSDAAEKRRWAYLPECAGPIDTTDMDFWQMPVGARFWKEFTRDGVRVETRLIERVGPGDLDFKFATYQWDLNGGAATRVKTGVANANGTNHDIPAEALCAGCHKPTWRILGFSAIQLSHDDTIPGESMASLSAEGMLSTPLPGGATIPGTAEDRAALGYLHANCSGCHHEGGISNLTMNLKVSVSATSVTDTDTWLTAVNQPTQMFLCSDGTHCDRIDSSSPSTSAIIQRMNLRGVNQMPPFGTEDIDTTAVDQISAWITTLAP